MNLVLLSTAASIGVIHTAIGVDHYLPFVAMGSANKWSFKKTMFTAFICGCGHILGSVLLGLIGFFIGSHVSVLSGIEGIRGNLATWLLIAFGLIYMLWGIRNAIKNKPHKHILSDGKKIWHGHAKKSTRVTTNGGGHEHDALGDGVHGHDTPDGGGHGHDHDYEHGHDHADSGGHGHEHDALDGGGHGHADAGGHIHGAPDGWGHGLDASDGGGHGHDHGDEHGHDHADGVPRSFWPLFILFVLGPCGPLIPLLIYPAAEMGLGTAMAVAAVYSVCTISTMLILTAVLLKGVRYLPMKKAERYAHALAGFAVLACGLAIQFLGL